MERDEILMSLNLIKSKRKRNRHFITDLCFYIIFGIILYYWAASVTFSINNPQLTQTEVFLHPKEVVTFQKITEQQRNSWYE